LSIFFIQNAIFDVILNSTLMNSILHVKSFEANIFLSTTFLIIKTIYFLNLLFIS